MNISVIIPLYNRHDLTVFCVDSIRYHTPDVEIVLVDNGSTDETELIPVTIRNKKNLGFAKACNQGADVATRDNLVFLNNDTIVHQGWLTFTRHLNRAETGCVGPKLIYPSGRIQSAGITVDFTEPLGREAKNISYDWAIQTTEVAAVTGACLAIRKELFEQLDGFDTGYWNGYEDVDLCLKATAAGYCNYYDPASKVTHAESQSGPERWSQVDQNIDRLRTKWSLP